MTTQTPANADRGKRSIWFWMWFAFLILAGILEFLAKQDASFRLSVQNFNSKMYSATVALSPLSIGKNYYLYMWSGGEPGVTITRIGFLRRRAFGLRCRRGHPPIYARRHFLRRPLLEPCARAQETIEPLPPRGFALSVIRILTSWALCGTPRPRFSPRGGSAL